MASVVEMRKPVIAEDDGVRERHGCDTRNGSYCQVREDGDVILVKVATVTTSLETGMAPARARYLARKLYRLARRIERREVGA